MMPSSSCINNGLFYSFNDFFVLSIVNGFDLKGLNFFPLKMKVSKNLTWNKEHPCLTVPWGSSWNELDVTSLICNTKPTIIFITNSLSYSVKMNPYYKWSLKKETVSDSKKKTRKPPSKSLCVKCFEIKKHHKSKASWPVERIKYLVAMNRKSSSIYD